MFAIDDFYTNFIFVLRWIHIIAGIIWIGHLYFFNFVNVPFQGVLEKEVKPKVNPFLLPRALWWFRWGAMITFLAGVTLLLVKYSVGQLWTDPVTGTMSHRAMWILWGALLGTIMWFNVWFVIWPTQKKILGLGVPKAAPELLPLLRARAGLFSKINTFLSGPMLFGMLAASHYGAINFPTFLVFAAIGLSLIWTFFRLSHRVARVS